MRKKFLFLIVLFLNVSVYAQVFTPSDAASFSILTIGPGDQLYDKFGHSAFRLNDPEKGVDIVYNYGVYDFDTPNFYTKFARGKMNYKLAVSYFEPFFETYTEQDRWVKEQILDLSYSQKLELFHFLQENAKPENQYYRYDFLFDNCATRIRDVLVRVLGNDLKYDPNAIDSLHTFRELIRMNVAANSWGSLGMDTAIGAVVDVEATPWEHQFLPEYIFRAAALATIDSGEGTYPLVRETRTLYEAQQPDKTRVFFWTSPLFIMGLLALVIIGATIRDLKRQQRSRWLDGLLFGITGIIGVLLLLLWLATEHSTTANNYNLLWAFPFSILFTIAISRTRPKKWLEKYVFFLLLLLVLLVIHWITGVQRFAIGLLPLFVALAVRYGYLYVFLKRLNRTDT